MDNKVLLKEETVVSIADAIREKSGSNEKMTPIQMAARIQNLTTTLPELENPGSAADLLAGKELIDDDGNVVVGTIPTVNASTITMSSPTSAGKVTAYYTHRAGYKASEQTVTKTVQLSTQSGKTITPTKSRQTAVSSSKWTTGTVYVAAIPSNYVDVSGLDIEPQDVVYGTEFIDGDGNRNTGTMPNIGAVNGHLEPMSGVETYTVPKGYHDGTGTVGIGEDLKDALITINGNTATNIAEAVNNVDTAVTDQANLITQIQTALEGKAAGGSGSINTCTITLSRENLSSIHLGGVCGTKYTNGAFVPFYIENYNPDASECISNSITIEDVVCGSCLLIDVHRSETAVLGRDGEDNFEYVGMLDRWPFWLEVYKVPEQEGTYSIYYYND